METWNLFRRGREKGRWENELDLSDKLLHLLHVEHNSQPLCEPKHICFPFHTFSLCCPGFLGHLSSIATVPKLASRSVQRLPGSRFTDKAVRGKSRESDQVHEKVCKQGRSGAVQFEEETGVDREPVPGCRATNGLEKNETGNRSHPLS